MIKLVPLIAFGLSWAGSASADAPAEALKKALSGPRVPFVGEQVCVVGSGSSRSEATVVVLSNGNGAVRREYRGSGKPTILLQIGGSSWTCNDGSSWTRLSSGGAMEPALAAATIAKNYRLTVIDGLTLLGRKCSEIRVTRSAPYNPSRRIWFEPSTGIVLRDDLYAPDGALRSSSRFKSVRVGKQPESLFARPSVATTIENLGPDSFQQVASRQELKRLTGRDAPLPKHIPHGYSVSSYGLMTTVAGRSMPAVRYSDGLASFTVFQRGQGRGGRGWGRGGPNSMRSDLQRAVVATRTSSGNYILIGDLAESELRAIADSL